jgi:hypothetical protein
MVEGLGLLLPLTQRTLDFRIHSLAIDCASSLFAWLDGAVVW